MSGIPILLIYCLILLISSQATGIPRSGRLFWACSASHLTRASLREFQADLARTIILHIRLAEKRGNRVCTTVAAPPPQRPDPALVGGLIVVAPGRKRVDLGTATLIYDQFCYLVTSIDLHRRPNRPGQRSETLSTLVVKLKLPVVHELLSREDMPISEASAPDSPAMAAAETTVEFRSAYCRMVDLPPPAPRYPLPQRFSGTRTPLPHPTSTASCKYRILQGHEGTRLRPSRQLATRSCGRR